MHSVQFRKLKLGKFYCSSVLSEFKLAEQSVDLQNFHERKFFTIAQRFLALMT